MPPAVAAAHALKAFRCDSFAGGLDVKTTPLRLATLPDGDRLTTADNMLYTTEGGVTKRFGKVAINTVTLGAAVVILGGTQYRLSSGTDYQVVGTSDGRVVRINTDGTTANLATGKSTTSGVRYRFATYNDLLIITNGYDAPMSWDGTTFGNLAGSPPATGQVVVVHGNRVFMTARAVPSRLYWSALNNAVSWTGTTDAGFLDVNPNDNSVIVDLVPAIQELVILKGTKPYRLQGVGPVTGYTVTDHLVPTVGSVGAISSQGAVFALNDTWYLSTLGLHSLAQTAQFGDLKEGFASERVEPYFQLDSQHAWALEHLNKAVVAYDAQANLILIAGCANDDGINDTTLVYDMLLKAWSVWTVTPYASLFTVRHPTTGAREVWAGGYDGFVYALTRSTGSTEAIAGAATHITTLGAPGVEKSLRYGFFYFNLEESAVTVQITFRYDFGAHGSQTYTASLAPPSESLWNGTTWNGGEWTSLVAGAPQKVVRLDLAGLGDLIEITVQNLEAAQQFTWLGYQIFYRDRRYVRRPH